MQQNPVNATGLTKGLTHLALVLLQNFMLSSQNPSNAVIKLIDFGCSVIIDEDDDDFGESGTIGLAGRTLAYCPPEMLDNSKRPDKPDLSVDMWALGVILYSKVFVVLCVMVLSVKPFAHFHCYVSMIPSQSCLLEFIPLT